MLARGRSTTDLHTFFGRQLSVIRRSTWIDVRAKPRRGWERETGGNAGHDSESGVETGCAREARLTRTDSDLILKNWRNDALATGQSGAQPFLSHDCASAIYMYVPVYMYRGHWLTFDNVKSSATLPSPTFTTVWWGVATAFFNSFVCIFGAVRAPTGN